MDRFDSGMNAPRDDDEFSGEGSRELKATREDIVAAAGEIAKMPMHERDSDIREMAGRIGVPQKAIREEVERIVKGNTQRRRKEVHDKQKDNLVKFPLGYEMRDDGLYEISDSEGSDIKLCGPFKVRGSARDGDGGGWSTLIEFIDPDEKEKSFLVTPELTLSGSGKLEPRLAAEGLELAGQWTHAKLRDVLSRVECEARLRLVPGPGWHGNAFMMPGGTTVGGGDEKLYLDQRLRSADGFTASGSLEDWKNGVAKLIPGNSLGIFFMSAAFAGPLLRPLEMHGGGFHIYGQSQSGKTTALQLAASVWGKPENGLGLHSWNATQNGLEHRFQTANDTLLCLDELQETGRTNIADAVYMAANGSGKGRLNSDASARETRKWRALFLSTGEMSLEDKARAQGGGGLHAGADTRCPSIPIPDGGCFQGVGADEARSTLAGVVSCSNANHGVAGLAWIKYLAENVENPDFIEGLRRGVSRIRGELAPKGADNQVVTVAERFAIVAVAGEEAIKAEILPWPPGTAEAAVMAAFGCWLADRGGAGSKEELQHADYVKGELLRLHCLGFREITSDGTPGGERIGEMFGFRRVVDGMTEYLVAAARWPVFCGGVNGSPMAVAKSCLKAGILMKGDGKNLTKKHRVAGFGNARYHTIRLGNHIEPDEQFEPSETITP
ncbi:DUF927 domain-containing protein [Roseomonas gilardii]|uniref:DUF927 domain-containing protein n=1 Tax=Roseomonas gilardii TaxID=257708 RepID=UPI000950C3EE|nr:DUF927 domain-containing protein [Roseomonas gilardii]